MNLAKKLSFVAGIAALFSSGCVAPSSRINNTQVRVKGNDKPLIVGIEGLGGGNLVHNLVANISYDLDMAQSTSAGNPGMHMDYIKDAYNNGNPIYLVGFSSGANEIRIIAEKCEREKIPINAIFMLDPTYISRPFPGLIHENANEVVCFRSYTPSWIVGGEINSENLENPAVTSLKNVQINCSHFGLPKNQTLVETVERAIRALSELPNSSAIALVNK